MLFDFPTVSRPMSRPILKKPSVSKESSANPGFEAKVFLYGQELNPQTWAIARSDLLKAKDGEFFIPERLRNGNTVELLGIWEQIHNPDFKGLGFETFKNQPGLKAETLPPLLPSSLPRFTFQRGQLFSSTPIPVCLGFLAKNKHNGKRTAVSELELVLAA